MVFSGLEGEERSTCSAPGVDCAPHEPKTQGCRQPRNHSASRALGTSKPSSLWKGKDKRSFLEFGSFIPIWLFYSSYIKLLPSFKRAGLYPAGFSLHLP